MLEKLVEFALKQKLVVALVVAALVVCGVWAFTVLPIEAFPDVLNESVQVITQMPGQATQDVEKRVTLPLEREFAGIPKVKQVRSVSQFGLSVIYLYFDDGVDGYWARSQTLEKIATAPLPPGIQPSLAPMASVTGEVLRYELTGPYSDVELRAIQDWTLEKEFRSVPGIADVTSYGGKEKSWEIQVDPLRLANYGFTIRQIADAVANSNNNAGGNMINWPTQSFVVRSDAEFKSRDDVEHVGLGQAGRAVVRLSEIGRVNESHLPLRGVVGRDKRDNIVQGIVLLRKGENPVVVGESIHDKLHELNTGNLLPKGVKLRTYYDRSKLVDRTTETVWHNLGEGLLLVIAILMLFLRDWRATFIVATVVPLSLLFAFLTIVTFHTPANLVSLGAIDFGMVVDGAVLIVESLLARWALERIQGTETPIADGVVSIVRPVFFSMLMIILAYIPIFTLQAVEGKMFRPLAWTVCFTLAGALFYSIVYVPTLLPWLRHYAMLHPHEDAPWLKTFKQRYLNQLHLALNQPKKVAIGAFAVVLVAIGASFFMGSEFLPELDEGALWIRATLPHSASISEGQVLARRVREILLKQPEVKTVISQLGGPEDGTDPNLFDNCEFFVDLKPKEQWKRFHGDREGLIEEVREEFNRIPGIDFNISQPIADNVEEAIAGVKGKNAVKIYGPDLDTLHSIAEQLEGVLKSIPGSSDVGITAATPIVPHLVVKLDRAKIADVGLNAADVNDLVDIAVGGKTVTQVYEGERRLDVVIRFNEDSRNSIEKIRNLPLSVPGGKRILLSQVASVSMVPGPQAIFREDGSRRIAVKFGVSGRDLGSVMKDALEKTKKLNLPSGYKIVWGGEYENQKRAMKRLMLAVPLTFVLLALVLFLFFQDLILVGAVLANMLLSATGGLVLTVVRGIPFSVSSGVGLLALCGVVALNSVTLLSSFQRRSRLAGGTGQPLQLRQLIVDSCDELFRPILMTATLAALAILPAALSHGMGSETQRPLATFVIGGLITAFPATLIVLPVLLQAVFTRFRRKPAPDSDASPVPIYTGKS